MAYNAFVEIKNLQECDYDEDFLEELEFAVNEVLGQDVAFSFPKDPSVTSSDIPVVVEVTFISTELKSYNIPTVEGKLSDITESLGYVFSPKRPVIAFLRKAEMTI